MMATQDLLHLCKSNFPRRIYMTTQSSNDGKQTIPPPAEQFQPLQSVFRRRLLTGVSTASVLATGANFGGVTSFLLGFSPETARSLKLDALYPVGGYFRYIDTGDEFEFIYPESWLGDQRLLYRAAGNAERSLDPPSLGGPGDGAGGGGGGGRRNVNEPVVAFGPPGSTGELNVSVIVSPVPIDFSIEAFGGAEEVGETIVRTITRSLKRTDVKGTLIASNLRYDSVRNVKYYELEFGVESPTFRRHNVAVCCVRNRRLYTLNAQAPESAWPQCKSQFYMIANSFVLI